MKLAGYCALIWVGCSVQLVAVVGRSSLVGVMGQLVCAGKYGLARLEIV